MSAKRWRWDWRGAVAFTLALCLGVGFAVSIIADSLRHEPISAEHAALLSTLGGALIGAVATWLGLSALDRDDEFDEREHEVGGGHSGTHSEATERPTR
jgi:Na+/H+ antiporter NhaA